MHLEIVYPATQGAGILRDHGISAPELIRTFLEGVATGNEASIAFVKFLTGKDLTDAVPVAQIEMARNANRRTRTRTS
jgi:hypothetical protein